MAKAVKKAAKKAVPKKDVKKSAVKKAKVIPIERKFSMEAAMECFK